jgi:hypothetical protein
VLESIFPVARLRLFDDRQARARALELLDIDLYAIRILEGFQQVGIGMIAPDQGVEIGGRDLPGQANSGEGGNGSAGKPAREAV